MIEQYEREDKERTEWQNWYEWLYEDYCDSSCFAPVN